ncbi:MAG: hypothetical protein AAB486_02655 [Patescibacteria group bacterium]
MDHRLNDVWVRFLGTFGLRPERTDYDELRIAGGAKNVAEVLAHLKVAFNKHGVRKIILTVHEDCAGGAVENDLFRARAEIRSANYIGLEVRLFYFYRSGSKWAWRDMTN